MLFSSVRTISLFVFFVLNSSLDSEAHESRPGYLELKQISEEEYAVLWKVPARGWDQRPSLNLRFSHDTRYLSLPTPTFINAAFVERFTIQRPGGLTGSEIYIEGLSRTLTDVLVRLEHLDGITQTIRLSPDNPSFIVESAPGSFEVSQTYTLLGIQHILEGIDHLLFVACLLLVAGMGRRLLITITGFTLAHSITLALATLDVVRVPVPPVEATIALSIVFLATEIARRDKDGLTYRYPVAVSVSFGLLHCFGFAAVLNQIGLPQSDLPLALLFLNVGVEIGQLLFIAALLIVYKLLIQTLMTLTRASIGHVFTLAKLERIAAYVIGTVSSYWMIERIYGFWR
ncbi:MAG: HupE/UreJ family protein [Verrucomicrobia bacterium]|nr:HupE/UreJ family protein [Verrucomicrobiota bacterium]